MAQGRTVSLKTKLILFTSGIVTLVALSAGAVYSIRTQKLAHEALNHRADSLSRVLALASRQGIEFEDAEGLRAVLSTLASAPDVAYAAVCGPDGTVLAALNDAPVPAVRGVVSAAPQLGLDNGLLNSLTHVELRGGSHGTLQIGFRLDEVRRAQRQNSGWLALTSLAVLAVGCALSWMGARVLVRPISDLTRVTEAIVRTGDLTQDVPVTSGDEIGELARSFQALVQKLRTIPVTLGESASGLSTAVLDLTSMTQAQTESVRQQAASLSEAATTIAQIKQTSVHAAEQAAQVMEVAAKAEGYIRAGQQAVEASINGLQEIHHQVDSLVERIHSLAEQTQQIEQIVETVKDLASQSNLLALNAAIEATWAGEYGEGFAVVAQEMRHLADQSLQSTTQVRNLLQNIQSAIQAAVALTGSGGNRITRGMEEVRGSGESLREITAIVQASSAAARQIATSVGQQNEGVVQVTATISQLSEAMHESVRGIQSVESSVRELQGASSRIVDILGTFKA